MPQETVPPVPRRVEPEWVDRLAAESTSPAEFFAAIEREGGYLVEDLPDCDECVLSIVRPITGPTECVIAMIEPYTHAHRMNLEPFLLERRSAHWGEYHCGAFLLPRQLRGTAGMVVEKSYDPEVGRQRALWREVFHRMEPLTRNREVLRTTQGGESNSLALPGAIPQPYIGRSTPARRRGRVIEQNVDSQILGIPLRFWLYLPHPDHTGRCQPTGQGISHLQHTAIFCDGDRLTGEATLLPALDHLHEKEQIGPTAVLFFAPQSPEDRPDLLGANPRLPEMLRDELLPWGLSQSTIPTTPDRLVIGGASLGGLAAADVLRRAPEIVSQAIVQSASFWWPGDVEDEHPHLRLWAQRPHDAPAVRIFHEVGSLESYLLDENREFCRIVEKMPNVDLVHREYVGGHDFACWRGGLVDGLIHFFRKV